MRRSLGIGLLELMLSLAIIAAVLLLATRYYLQAREASNVTQATQIIGTLVNASFKWLEGNNDFSELKNINTLVDDHLLPESWRGKKDPWGGTLNIASYGTDNQQLEISLGGPSESACESINDIMTRQGMQLNNNCTGGGYVGIYPETQQ
jgi:type II secretory pathway pseudopilin PulG